MDENPDGNESLIARIHQLEREREELHKDIEQLCMQQAGPSYLAVATRMHFQRTANLEQEIENLRTKLAACMRERLNLQEELSEAYRIKSQLADLHSAEMSKNMEVEKQLKFFHGCVASAFAERDKSIMEAEKAKEKAEHLSKKLSGMEKRIEELTSDFLEEKTLATKLQIDLEKQATQDETFKMVIDKFYEIRQHSMKIIDNISWQEKCECLLHDSAEMWRFSDHEETSTSKYISALEEEVEKLRTSKNSLQNKQRVGLEIENHLKKKVLELEKEKVLLEEKIVKGISGLLDCHYRQRVHIINLLDEGYSHLKSTTEALQEKIRQLYACEAEKQKSSEVNGKFCETECRDVHVDTDPLPDLINTRNVPRLPSSVAVKAGEASDTLAQALQEKVAALLLLSQQEEMHLLERNVNAALQKKIEELHRNLLQVTNEKVKALMELAQLKQEYQLLQEKTSCEMQKGKSSADIGDKRIVQDGDGRLKNLLKRTNMRRWLGKLNSDENESQIQANYARMKIENATLKESLENMEHLTTSVRRLRISLLKVKESVMSGDSVGGMSEDLENVITEAKLLKTALCSSLPISWSAEACDEAVSVDLDSVNEKVDFVSAAGLELVELLVLAAIILKEQIHQRG